MLLTVVYIAGLLFRPKRRIAGMGIDSLVVLGALRDQPGRLVHHCRRSTLTAADSPASRVWSAPVDTGAQG